MKVEDFEKLNTEEKEKFYDYIYKQKYDGVNLHTQPAPETRERLKALEVSQQFMVDEISEIKSLVKGLDDKLNCALEKKADKADVNRIYSFLYWLGGIIGVGILGYLGSLLVKLINL
jgi:hypothetical protein